MSRRGHKYGAVRTTVDGVTFASKAEARRYAELKLLEKSGVIEDIELQPVFPLAAPATALSAKFLQAAERIKRKGKNREYCGYVVVGEYRADFAYRVRANGLRMVEDVKGFKTPLYRWKKKHVEAQYGISITEVSA